MMMGGELKGDQRREESSGFMRRMGCYHHHGRRGHAQFGVGGVGDVVCCAACAVREERVARKRGAPSQ
eukprot:3939441-Rhodomonas_salina.5